MLKRRPWVVMAFGYAFLLITACNQGETPVAGPEPTEVLSPTPPAASISSAEGGSEEKFRELANEVINGTGQLARIISSIGISLAGNPADAAEARETVAAVKGSLELASRRMQRTDPPPGYQEFHRTLLDALSFYTQASAALLPDTQTGKANYPLFQELMLQGGKNFHSAGKGLSELGKPNDQGP